MTDLATLGLAVDSRGVRTATGDLDRFGRAGAGAERSAGKAKGAFAGMAGGALRMAASIGLGISALTALTGAFRATQQYAVMTNSLRAIGMSGSEAAAALEQIGDIAARTRAPLEATAQLYQRISIAGRDLGASSSDVLRFTENVGLALAQVGGGGAAASGALLQLSQAMSGGIVRAEEFNSILEGAFPIAQAAANAIEGAAGSVGQLRNMVIAGEVSSREFFEAVLSQSDALEATFANTIPTVSGALQVFRDQMTLSLGSLDSMVGGSESFARAIILMAENLDVVGATLGVAVTAFGVRYVGALALAKIATFTFAGALGILKTALITTGIGALVVGAGYLVAMFGRLVTATGGFSNAMTLVKDVAVEAWERIGYASLALDFKVSAAWQGIKASALGSLAGIVGGLPGFVNPTIGAFVGAYQAVVAAWGALPAAFARLGAQAMNGLIDAVEAGVGGLVTALNVIPGIDIGAPDLSNFRVEVGEAEGVVEAAGRAFEEAFSRDYTGEMSNGLRGAADEAANASEVMGNFGRVFTEAAGAPMESIAALNTVMDGNASATEGAAAETARLREELDGIGGAEGGGGGSAGAAAEAIEEATTFAEGLAEAFKGAQKSAADMGREFGGSVISGIESVSDAFGDFVVNGFKDFKGFVQSVLDSFKQMIAQMISMAVRSRVMRAFGAGGTGIGASGGGVGQAVAGGVGGGGGGFLSNLLRGGGGAGAKGAGGGAGMLGAFGTGSGLLGLGGGSSILGLGAGSGLAAGIGSLGVGAGLAASLSVAIPVIGAVALAFAAFRKKTKTLDTGIMATVNNMDVLVETFKKVQTSRFFGLSKKVRTSTSAADRETTDAVTSMVDTLQSGVMASADALGLAANTFDGFSHRMRISTKGLSDEAAQRAVMDGLTGMADAMAGMVGGLDGFMQAGEGASATLDRLASSLTTVNAWMGNFQLRAYDVSLAGGAAASAFVDLFGSLENFTSAAASYYQNFYTDAERLARATSVLSLEMASLGIDALPATRAAFRALVDEADALGDTDMVAALMQLSPAFAEISAGADALGGSLRALVNEDLFATGQDYMRGLSRVANGLTYGPKQSDAELRAELRALNVSMERLISSSEITAGNTGRGADAADDTLAFQLEQTL